MISRFWHGARAKLRRAFRGETETAEEIRLHIELLAERHRAAGLPPEEAQRQAGLAFGNAASLQERLRDQRPGFSAELWRRDFTHAFRFLGKNPAFGAVTVLSFAFALGANVAIFGLVDALLFKSLAVHQPDRLALFWWSAPKGADPGAPTMGWRESNDATGESSCTSFPQAAYAALAEANIGLSDLFAFAPMRDLILQRRGEAEPVQGLTVSGNYFRGLGVELQLGRGLSPEDEASRTPAVVISDALWARWFGRSPDVLGQSLSVSQVALTIVGVTQREFLGTVNSGERADLYVPLSLAGTLVARFEGLGPRGIWWLRLMGRLAPGVTREEVAARAGPVALRGMDAALKLLPPRENDAPARVLPSFRAGAGAQGLGEARRAHRTQLGILASLGLVVLGIACTNVANLLVARGIARQREVAVKLALGATRGRVLRQFLVEAFVIAGSGALLGLVFAGWFRHLLLLLRTGGVQSLAIELSFDHRLAIFTVLITTLCALLAGAWPAWRNSGVDPSEGFRNGVSGGRRPLSNLLLVVQMALSVVLLVCCGLFLRTVNNLRTVDVGFDPSRILMVAADGTRAGLSAAAAQELYARLADRFARLPGVQHASYAVIPPLSNSGWNGLVQVPGRPPLTGRNQLAMFNAVGRNFFAAFGLPALRGRVLDERDLAGSRLTAVVNQAFARRFFGRDDPVGQSFVMRGGDEPKTFEIVGLVRDTLYHDVRAAVEPIVFVGYQHGFSSEVTFFLRSQGDAAALGQTVRATVSELAPTLALTDFRTQEAQIEQLSATEAVFARLAVVFSALAVFLTCGGVYGLVAYRAARRTTEFGVRLALGAPPRSVLWLVWREGLLLGLLGVAGGWAASFAIVKLLQSNLYGVAARDPWSFTLAGVLVVTIGVFAAALPAWRAMRVDPAACLRAE